MCVLRGVGAAALLTFVLGACGTETEVASGRDRASEPSRSDSPIEDQCGDANADEPVGDGSITSVDVEHGETEVSVEVGLRELGPTIEQNVTVLFASPDRAWTFNVGRLRRGNGADRIHTFFAAVNEEDYPDPDDPDAVCGAVMIGTMGDRCPGARGLLDAERTLMTVLMPRPCLENPASVQIGVRAHFVDGGDIVANDRWDEYTDSLHPLLPPLGDPVAAAPGAPIGCQEREQRHQDPPGPGQVVVMGPLICIR